MEKCIFCSSPNIEVIEIPKEKREKVNCPLCGSYIISEEVAEYKVADTISPEDRI